MPRRAGAEVVIYGLAADASGEHTLNLCSNASNQRIRTAVQAVTDMKCGLDSDRRTIEARRSKRAKQLDQLAGDTAAMYGELDSLMGTTLPAVELVALPPAD